MANPQSICRGTYQEDERVHLEDGGDKIVINSGGTLEVKAGATVTGISGSGSPGGADTQVQFNDGGVFGGDAGFTFNKTAKTIYLGPSVSSFSATAQTLIGLGANSLATLNPSTADGFVVLNEVVSGPSVWTFSPIHLGVGGGVVDVQGYITANDVGQHIKGVEIFLGQDGTGDNPILTGLFIQEPYYTGANGTVRGIHIDDQAVRGNNNIALFINDQTLGAGNYAILVGGGNSDLGPDTTSVGQLRITAPAVPASAGATGVAGTIAWDADFLYVCIATNTWKRAALSTW